MRLLRRLLLISVTSLLRLTIFFGVSFLAALFLLGRPNHLEHTLITTGTYKQFTPAIVQSFAAADHNAGGIPFDDPGVRNIIVGALPPPVVQKSTETVINSTYDWLNGKTLHPIFRIDLTQNRQLLIDNLTAYAFNRLAAQPLCTTQPQTVDPFTAPCLPRNYDINEERAAFGSEIDALFPKTVFTADDLPRFSNGKSIAHDFPEAPRIYRLLSFAPWLFGTLVVLLSTIIMFASRNRRRGLKLLASVIISSGVALVVTPLLYLVLYPHISHAFSLQATSSGVNVLVNNIVSSLGSDFNNYVLKGSLIIINLGLLLLLVERLTRPDTYSHVSEKAGLANGSAQLGSANDGSVLPDMVPLQSSEQTAKRKPKRRFAINHKPEDGAS